MSSTRAKRKSKAEAGPESRKQALAGDGPLSYRQRIYNVHRQWAGVAPQPAEGLCTLYARGRGMGRGCMEAKSDLVVQMNEEFRPDQPTGVVWVGDISDPAATVVDSQNAVLARLP